MGMEVQARLDLQRQTMNDLLGHNKNLQDQKEKLQDQNKNQKKDHERELNTCIGTFIVVLLTFAAFMICGFLPSSSSERCSCALEAKAVQMTATPTTVTVTLPVATPTIVTVTLPVATNAVPTIKAASSTHAATSTEPIRSVVHDYRKIEDRYLYEDKGWQQEEEAKQKEIKAQLEADFKKGFAQWEERVKQIYQRNQDAQEEFLKQALK
ncbi:uncharacterized protein J4E78_008534 [Alternaria triticimaculans]|uniref:uncharacterized protein n=1 Tax=Alternaria triticimaculans TaxID=297637 RepID=UPI0020C42CC5|nr:uncharacterized protein J4E78_008534 [Alternaria triticimaculans]KAI4649016.1 hypothetical protein J4E78_008534 [Alternaria triticimaculans]